MENLHFINGINPRVLEESIKLAVSEAPAMVHQHIDHDSPLLPLAEAEVEVLLGQSLRMVGADARERIDGHLTELKVGLIAVIDDEGETPLLAGFLQYKPRIFAEGMASIGYAAVAKPYRHQGVFTRMLDELKSHYPILGLDCPLELVSMYEKLGFKVDNAQGAHVGMYLGALGGKNWHMDQASLERNAVYLRAKERVRDQLGKGTREAYAKRDADTQNRVEEVNGLLAQKGLK
ncbi:GNAT family N-acetyltransferase [Pseudomonas viridiflava]|uniref:GNAT family N-acetyltransferase n=2 Tax=Pseudomonas viridiflava TaxID=33069 RepID=UPI000F021834|nr:GNAT family N-acetyltransferase [Pseudomonas viridiflava]